MHTFSRAGVVNYVKCITFVQQNREVARVTSPAKNSRNEKTPLNSTDKRQLIGFVIYYSLSTLS